MATAPALAVSDAGQITVTGPVTFATAGTLLEAGRALFAGRPAVTVDLRQVSDVDSAGLALLLEWLRQARTERRAIAFHGVPDKLLAIARLSGVEPLLTAAYSSTAPGPSGASGDPLSGSASTGASSR